MTTIHPKCRKKGNRNNQYSCLHLLVVVVGGGVVRLWDANRDAKVNVAKETEMKENKNSSKEKKIVHAICKRHV
eukprot:CAMPEP_0116827386 /NCGR_PEP_ID=MMETSP0418-20121206/3068_1 /TAXON_ID=1158023 /ORGANISM="Astrosyne radiata, Strain 13vi08-1A" /LENGTH=73 /DNA_ID=CAMNT_0004456151 /DNA_START=534 /DNA_END=755 /DNA_ORIENTATION=-